MGWFSGKEPCLQKLLSEQGLLTPPASTAPVPEISEKEFQQQVMDEAKRHGWRAYHVFDSRKSNEGFLDFLALRAGRLVIAELKVGDNVPTATQENWLADWRLVPGTEVWVWYPKDWNTILGVLQ